MNDLLMKLNEMVDQFESFQAATVALQSKLSNAQAALDAASKQSYDEGYAAGVASVEPTPVDPVDPGGDKMYSQEELDAEIVSAVASFQEQIDVLQVQLDEMSSGNQAQIDAGVAALKADLKAKYEEQQVAETSGETGFASMLG